VSNANNQPPDTPVPAQIEPDDDPAPEPAPAAPIEPTDDPAPEPATAAPTPNETYQQLSGPAGRRRRRTRRKTAKFAPLRTLKPSATPRRRSTRTRMRTAFAARRNHQSSLPDLPMEHWACHGTALNPDTGNIAEYKELSTCSDGKLWSHSNADEIGRMFQGLGPDSYMPKGTETLWFIDRHKIPKHKKPTYVRVVCADRPEKPNDACAGLLEGTALCTPATKRQKLLTYLLVS
jgi:hypothetical protein